MKELGLGHRGFHTSWYPKFSGLFVILYGSNKAYCVSLSAGFVLSLMFCYIPRFCKTMFEHLCDLSERWQNR